MVMENEQKKYELTCILEPHLEGADLDNFKKDLEKIATNNNGRIEHFSEPEKRELAYPINKQGQAIYVACHLIFENNNVAEFLKELKTNKLILRHLITVFENTSASDSDKPRLPRKPRIKKEEEVGKPSFTKVSEDKKDDLNLEEIDKKLDELVGL
jgi:ribosomal protein S6